MFKTRTLSTLTVALALVSQLGFVGCSHKKDVKQLSKDELQSKRVALVEIKGAPQSKTQVEVSIINEIVEHGRFEIVDRTSVREAQVTYPTESDWKRLGEKLDADYLMSVRVAEFKVDERQGYDAVDVEDSVLAQEAGESEPIKTKRYEKVKAYTGVVRLNVIFYDVKHDAILYQGVGEASDVVNSRDMKLPSRLALLEKLTQRAMADFFAKMP